MPYRLAADLVLLVHFLFAAFAVFGGALAAYNFYWAWLHTRAGQSGYPGGFIQHYVGRAVYPRGMPRQLELVADISILVGNPAVYAAIPAHE